MSGPARANCVVYCGAAYALRFTMTAPGSIANWTLSFTVRPTPSTANPPTLRIPASVVDAGDATRTGVIVVELLRDETLALVPGSYAYSLMRTDAGVEDLLTIGTLTAARNVYDPVGTL